MSISKKEKISNDHAYLEVVQEFIKHRTSRGTHKRDIEIASNTGGGRISYFENLLYSPTLLTFIRWCEAAGIQVKLVHGQKKRLIVRKAVELHKEKLADPGRIITQLQQEHFKSKNK